MENQGRFKDPFNPLNIYAAEGENGVDGGDGGSAKRTAPISTGNFNSSPGGDASYNNKYLGGAVGTAVNMVVPSQNIDINCQGGSGGGAAVGNPGWAGDAAIDSGGTAYPGNGGNGRSAISRTEAMNPGQGGHGGHGGGGGGGGGHSFSVWGNKVCTSTSNGGPGGAGGYASNGGSGAVIFLLEDGL